MTEPPNLPPRRPKNTAAQAPHESGQPVPASGGEPVAPAKTKKGGAAKWLLLLLLLGAIGGGMFLKMQMDAKAEEAASARLKEMGLIHSNRNNRISMIGLVTLKDQALFDEAIALLPDLKALESVNLKQTLISDKDMPTIGKIKSAITLDMSDTKVTDAGLKHIASMKNLQTLYLSGTGATNALMPTIAKLKKLRIIEISGGDITGGLEPLATLPQLSWLVLRGIHIKDSSLAELGKSKTISHLTLTDTEIDDLESLETFKQLTDNVKVD